MPNDAWWQGFGVGLLVGLAVAIACALHWLWTELRRADPRPRGATGEDGT